MVRSFAHERSDAILRKGVSRLPLLLLPDAVMTASDGLETRPSGFPDSAVSRPFIRLDSMPDVRPHCFINKKRNNHIALLFCIGSCGKMSAV